MKLCTILSILIMPSILWALVDYSDDSTVNVPFASSSVKPATKQTTESVSKEKAPAARIIKSAASFKANYQRMKFTYEGEEGIVSKTLLNLFLQTPYNFYLDLNYPLISTDMGTITPTSSTRGGNPTAKAGFNFLRVGQPTEMATIDLYYGVALKEKASPLASSRNDQLVGLNASKRFMNAVLGLGYDLRLTGRPDQENEMDIGMVQHLTLALGYQVSSDIRFLLEGDQVKIGASKTTDRTYHLATPLSFAYLTPQVQLTLNNYMGITLGSTFLTKKPTSLTPLVQSRYYEYPGAFGNMIFFALDLGF